MQNFVAFSEYMYFNKISGANHRIWLQWTFRELGKCHHVTEENNGIPPMTSDLYVGQAESDVTK